MQHHQHYNKSTNSSMSLILLFMTAQNLLLVSGSSPSDQVHQTPLHIQAKPGQTARISCSHSIQSYDVILWYKSSEDTRLQLLGHMYLGNKNLEPGVDVKMELDGGAEKGQTCTLIIKELTVSSSAVYFCAARLGHNLNEAYFGKGTKLTVLDPDIPVTPPTVKLLRPSNRECKGKNGKKKKTLVCVASDFYPDHVGVFWQLNGLNITDGVATDAAAKRNGSYYQISSQLRVPIKQWLIPENQFTCFVYYYNGAHTNTYNDSITSNAVNTGMSRETYMKITQSAKLSYSALIVKSCLYAAFVCFLVWKLQGKRGKQHK